MCLPLQLLACRPTYHADFSLFGFKLTLHHIQLTLQYVQDSHITFVCDLHLWSHKSPNVRAKKPPLHEHNFWRNGHNFWKPPLHLCVTTNVMWPPWTYLRFQPCRYNGHSIYSHRENKKNNQLNVTCNSKMSCHTNTTLLFKLRQSQHTKQNICRKKLSWNIICLQWSKYRSQIQWPL